MSNEQIVAAIKDGINVKENMLQLWQQNQGIIRIWVNRYSGYAEHEDLEQESYLGLHEAVKHFDAERGVLFVSYADQWVNQVIRRYIDNYSRTIRMPVYLAQLENKYKKLVSDYIKLHGCVPKDSELSSYLGIEEEKLQELKKSMKMIRIRSLDEPIGEEAENITIADSVASDENIEESVVKHYDYKMMQKELWKAVDDLPSEQRKVIRKRYQEQMTMKAVGQQLEIGMVQAKGIEAKAMKTLRLPSKSKKYRGYYETYLKAHSFCHVGLSQFNNTWTSEVEREVLRRFERSKH